MKYTPLPTNQTTSQTSRDGWRPWPLRNFFLALFTTICIILCLSIELIMRACSESGCYVFQASGDSLSTTTNVVYNLLPTIIILAVSLLWALAHHDVMRLEPYFRMSTSGGETAAGSIFLEYPYTFPLFVLYQATKRKHYVVLLSTIVLLLMNLLITPVFSGIFDETLLQKSQEDLALRKRVRPGAGALGSLSAGFTHVGYDYAWLNGSLPPFTTPTYALLPVLNDTSQIVGNEIWNASTTLFQAELTCEEPSSIGIRYSNTSGIKLDFTTPSEDYTVYICDQAIDIGVRDWVTGPEPPSICDSFTTFLTPWASIAYQVTKEYSESGSVNGSATYLYAWGQGGNSSWNGPHGFSPMPRNLTALFCKTTYYSQEVTATFQMPSGNVIAVNRTGPRVPFMDVENIERVVEGSFMALKVPAEYRDSNGYLAGFGYMPPQLPNVDSQLQRRLGSVPNNIQKLLTTDNGIGAVLGGHSIVYLHDVHGLPGLALRDQSPESLGELLNPQVLTEVYNSTLQLLFALAISVEMIGDNEESVPVVREVWIRGYTINCVWARVAQGALAVVVVTVMTLILMIGRRHCYLDGEPNNLGTVLRLLWSSPDMSATMRNSEFYAPGFTLQILNQGGRRYKLQLVAGSGPTVRAVIAKEHYLDPFLNEALLPLEGGSEATDTLGRTGLPPPDQENPEPWTEVSWPMKTISGVGLLFYYVAVSTTLTVLFTYSRCHNGLPTPGPINSLGYKVLVSYIPIAVGMGMEPALVTLGSCYCMLGPYKALTKGSAPSSKSITVDYDKSPPHFQLLRSLRTRDIGLAALTTSILLTNVVTVAFAGLFTPGSSVFQDNTQVRAYQDLHFRGTFTKPAQEMYYILSSSLSERQSAPTWTTKDYYVLPFHPIAEDDSYRQEYEGSTMAIGVNVTCKMVSPDRITMNCPCCRVSRTVSCPGNKTFNSLTVRDSCWPKAFRASGGLPSITWYGPSQDLVVQSLNCPGTFFPVWLERPGDPHPENRTGLLYQNYIGTVIMKCRSAEVIVDLTATVNREQQVISTTNVRPWKSDRVSRLYAPNSTTMAHLAPAFVEVMHNGTYAESGMDEHLIRWFDYLMTIVEPSILRNLTNLTAIPDRRYVAGAFEDIYRRLFAINLGLYADDIISPQLPLTLPGVETVVRDRLYMSTTIYSISISILVFTIVVLIVLYWVQKRHIIGHLPKNLFGMYVHLYASNAKEECGQVMGSSKERARSLEQMRGRYTYGRFAQGRHFGVYRVNAKGSEDIPLAQRKEMGYRYDGVVGAFNSADRRRVVRRKPVPPRAMI